MANEFSVRLGGTAEKMAKTLENEAHLLRAFKDKPIVGVSLSISGTVVTFSVELGEAPETKGP